MALVNYSLPFGASAGSWATISPIQPHAVNNLYEPASLQQENVLHNDDYYKNGPYRHQQPTQPNNNRNYLPPQQQAQNTNRNAYIPPTRTRTYGETSYSQQPSTAFNNQQNTGYSYSNGQRDNPYQAQQTQPQPQTTKAPNPLQSNSNASFNRNQAAGYPEQPPGYKPIQAGQGSRAQSGELLTNISIRLSFKVSWSIVLISSGSPNKA